MKVTPGYYTAWLAWAWERYHALDGQPKEDFLKGCWEAWGMALAGLAHAFPITLGRALKLAATRWDPLEETRNKMDQVRKTYGGD